MNDISQSTRKLLALSMLPGVGPATLRKVSCIANFATVTVEALAARLPSLARALELDGAWAEAQEKAERQVLLAEEHDSRILSTFDAEYPLLLAMTNDDPCLLHVRGKLGDDPSRAVAVIGTRKPTTHGKEIAKRISTFFAEQGWSVVSGLALGCDAVAHKAAIDAKGHTIAVLAHSLQTIAPSQNYPLAQKILDEGGALVSEFKFGTEPIPQHFVKRDQTQAGLARGVVMIQSDVRGGSLHASRAAISYKRWLAVPYPTDQDREKLEPKIQANLLLAEGSEQDKIALLGCELKSLGEIIILRGKDDYVQMLHKPMPNDTRLHSPPEQSDLNFAAEHHR